MLAVNGQENWYVCVWQCHLLVSFLFFDAHYILRNNHTLAQAVLAQAICCCFFMPCLMYACQLLLLIWASYKHFYLDRLPQAICCCLQPYTVIDVLLIMYCMGLPAFFVTSADKSQLWVY